MGNSIKQQAINETKSQFFEKTTKRGKIYQGESKESIIILEIMKKI